MKNLLPAATAELMLAMLVMEVVVVVMVMMLMAVMVVKVVEEDKEKGKDREALFDHNKVTVIIMRRYKDMSFV